MVNEDALRARYSIVEIDEEGVLLDRESGAVFSMNATACAIWKALLNGESSATIAAGLVRRFGVPLELAERDTRTALIDLPAPQLPERVADAGPNSGRWASTSAGYAFVDQLGSVACEVDHEGNHLWLPRGQRLTEGEARARVRSVVPRVLALRGIHLLHASAVGIAGTLTLFTGPSGAGKTTTARAFARRGARLISEDLLLLAGPAGVVDGELTVRKWVADQGACLVRRPDEAIACDSLDRCVEGERVPISRVLIIDAARRVGDHIEGKQLSRAEALVALMPTAYFASPDGQSWRHRLQALCDLLISSVAWRVTMPSGLAALETAVATSVLGHRDMIAS